MLVGDAPHARVYVPEPLRAGVAVGQRARVFVGADDGEQVFEGTVRMIRSEPTFTPYYALIGDAAARLSYLAEIQPDEDAGALPAGLPVRVALAGGHQPCEIPPGHKAPPQPSATVAWTARKNVG